MVVAAPITASADNATGDVDRFWHAVVGAYQRHLVDGGREEAFIILVSFVLTFLIVRVITHAIRAGRGPFGNLSVGGMHLHHLVPGIILLIVTGYLANALHVRTGRSVVAVFFGIGAALTLDEFALWLHLEDVYWSERGRRSIDVVIVAACIGALLLLNIGFWNAVGRAIGRFV